MLQENITDFGNQSIYTHTHIHTVEYYAALKEKEILSHATTLINLKDIMLSEISLPQKGKDCMIPLMCNI